MGFTTADIEDISTILEYNVLRGDSLAHFFEKRGQCVLISNMHHVVDEQSFLRINLHLTTRTWIFGRFIRPSGAFVNSLVSISRDSDFIYRNTE